MHPSEANGLLPLTLVVDDDPMMRLIATQTLTQHGLRVIEAAEGEQALELFARMQPDLVLLDVLMPGIDGYETCRRLRELKRGRHVPVLMLTGLDDLESINNAYEAGATDFVSKPINWAVLGHRVRYMLRAAETFKDLADSQAMLSSAQRIARLGSWSWDLHGDHGQCSDQTYSILGYEPGMVALGAKMFLARVHPEETEPSSGGDPRAACRHEDHRDPLIGSSWVTAACATCASIAISASTTAAMPWASTARSRMSLKRSRWKSASAISPTSTGSPNCRIAITSPRTWRRHCISPNVTAACLACCRWTSISSSVSTIPSGTRWATSCCSGRRAIAGGHPGGRTRSRSAILIPPSAWRAWAATSSAFS